eukprot:gene4762-6842_t
MKISNRRQMLQPLVLDGKHSLLSFYAAGIFILFSITLAPALCSAHTAQEWKDSRIIYQLGANAVWVSPIPENTNNGYHGYWQKDIYQLNSYFGASNDLLGMVDALHQRDMWVMLDVVINHMGNQDNGNLNDFSMFNPFNDASHYHSYCQIEDFHNMHEVQFCRLANLPDLAQENSYVLQTLQSWLVNTVKQYSIDGIRFDTVLEVPVDIWATYINALSNPRTYTIGEVDNGDPSLNAIFQGAMDATLNYPMYWTLRHVFQEQQSAYMITSSLQQQRSAFKDISVLGLFLDNHDNPRFLNIRNDQCSLRNALAYIMFAEGIPIVYYGTEQGFTGGNDPNNREDLWRSGYSTSTPLFKTISTLAQARKNQTSDFYSSQQVEKYVLDNFYAYTRGQVLVVTTNGGCGAQAGANIPNLPYTENAQLCNVLAPNDCIWIHGGSADIQITSGEPKVYIPTSNSYFRRNTHEPLYVPS